MRLLSAALIFTGILLTGQSFYMQAKAQLAQILIAHSWRLTDENKLPSKPWPWADTSVIARLEVPRLQQTLFVMRDDSGESLAFGPGHMPDSARPGQNGHVVISGHRDSHFSFLQNIRPGDLINTENYQAHRKRYRVTDIRVVDTRSESLYFSDQDQLTLISCYPFNSLVPGGPFRFVVNAEPVIENLKVAANAFVARSKSKKQTKPDNRADPTII